MSEPEPEEPAGFIGLIVIGLLSLLAVCLFDVAAATNRQTAEIQVIGHESECSLASEGAALQRRINEARGAR